MLSRLSTTLRLSNRVFNTAFFSTASQAGEEAYRNFDLFNPTEEHAQLREMLRSFAENEIAPQAIVFNREERFNRELFQKCGELGLLGITADVDFGGSGMDATAAVITHEEMSRMDPAFTLSYLAHSILFVNNLNQNGSEEQKAKYLPSACAGEKVGGMCMSEPGAGTDVLGMSTNATYDEARKGFVINGSKLWITNGTTDKDGETGDVFLVYARTGPGKTDISLFLVEKDMGGFTLGQKITDKLGMRASPTAELIFDNCFVPEENLVGELNKASLCMMRNLEIERITLAAMSVGIAKQSLVVMNSYANEREAFGKKINSFGQIQRHIADSYADYAAGRSYLYHVANNTLLDDFQNTSLDSDGVKLFCGNMGKQVADRAIQVLGGNGYTGLYNVERLWRDAKLLEIGGGTNEAHHKNMVRELKRTDEF
jgi:isovaleryl-CoA dehydrogenase